MTYTSEILLALITKAESLFQRLSNEDLSNLSKGRRLKHQQKLESLWLYKEALSYINDLELYTEESTKTIYKALLDIVSGKDTAVSLNGNGTISSPSLDYYSPVLGLLSVGLDTNSGTVFTIVNSPLTSSGTLEINLDSQNANLILASPSGASGVPTFRALVEDDIPTLTSYIQNQNISPQTANGWISGNFKVETDLYVSGTSYLDAIRIPNGNSITFGSTAVLISGSTIGNELVFTTNNALRLTINSSGSTFTGSVTASSFVKSGGTSGQFLKANGSVDSSTYLTANQTITLSSEASGSGTTSIAVTLSNAAVIGKVLTGYTSGAGTVAATDTILSAIQKLDGNIQALSGGGGTIDGSGTTNYIPKFSASTTLANSVMAEVGSNILIGTVTDDTIHKLQVYGNAKIGANGTSGIITFPNTTSGFVSKFETEYGSNAFKITGASNEIYFTQNSVIVGAGSAYLTVNKGTHITSLSTNATERLKIEGTGFPNKTQFLDTRVLINNTVDNGVDILQVTGTASFTGDLYVGSTRIGRGPNSGNNNIVLGIGAGTNITQTETIAIGRGSMASGTGGYTNIGIGLNTLYSATGDYNIAIGGLALQQTTTGTSNLAMGYQTMFQNTTGSRNIGIGYFTLNLNTTGNDNVAIGNNSTLSANTTGSGNVAIGSGALALNITGDLSVAMGTSSLSSSTAGTYNVGIGPYTLLFTTGSYNTSCGGFAGRSTTTGQYNTFIGYYAGYTNTTGSYNVVLGSANLPSATQVRSLLLSDGDGNIKLYSPATHNIILGGTTDDTVNKLQVTGSAAISTALTLGTTLTLTTNPTLTSTVLNDILVRDSGGVIKRVSSNDISFIKLRKSSIDALTTGTYTISNLQDNFVPIGYTVVVNTATAVSGAATVSIGTNSTSYNNVDTLPALGLVSAATTGQVYTKFFDDINKNKLNSADDLRVNVSVAATGTTYNIDIILFGYIIT